jgi:hypothetical protein
MIKIDSGVCRTLEITMECFPIPLSQSTYRIGSSTCITSYLIVARVAIILWINLAVMPVELVFDTIEAELERRGIEL